MKTISMDFETYKTEILLAKQEGAKINNQIIKNIQEIFQGLNSHDSEKFMIAKLKLNDILNSLTNYNDE